MKETDTDEIWPRSEGGPKLPWNQREISPHENRSRGSRMPTPREVFDSPDPPKLAVEIDRHTLTNRYKTKRNRGKGFGGLDRL
jgi:hypothetical protein